MLDRRIRIERAVVSRDDFNAEILTWGLLASVAAKFWESSDAESVQADQVLARVGAVFIVRWTFTTSTITARDRITYRGQVFNIRAVTERGRREYLDLQAVAQDD